MKTILKLESRGFVRIVVNTVNIKKNVIKKFKQTLGIKKLRNQLKEHPYKTYPKF